MAEFVYGSKRNVPDYIVRSGATYRVTSDQLGSPRRVTNMNNISDMPFSASYTSFGRVSGGGLDWMPFGFAGGIYDSYTGLVRFGARDYDPDVGRWLSSDPVRFDGGINLYAYAGSDPLNRRDPSGLFFCNTTSQPLVVSGGTGSGSGHTGGGYGTGTLAPGQCIGPGVPLMTPAGPLYDVDAADFGDPDGKVDPPMTWDDHYPFGDKVSAADGDHFGWCAIEICGYIFAFPCYEF